MSSIQEESAFLNKVRKNTQKKPPGEANRINALVSKLLFILGYLTIFFGIAAAILFISVMETTFSSLGGSTAGSLVESISGTDENVSSLVDSVNLNWIPDFIKIYSIRWPITLAIAAFSGAIALIVFSLAINRKKKS